MTQQKPWGRNGDRERANTRVSRGAVRRGYVAEDRVMKSRNMRRPVMKIESQLLAVVTFMSSNIATFG